MHSNSTTHAADSPTPHSDEDQALLRQWDAFCAAHAKAAQGKGTVGPKSRPNESTGFSTEGPWESARGHRYQELVRRGLMPQVKAKYRG